MKWRKRQTKKIQEINKSLKESKESQERTTKQMNETIQTIHGLKAELETIKKTQNEGMLEIEKLSK